MIPTDFDYARPASGGEALSLLGRAGAMPLARGQSLVPLLADRSVTADLLVDISRLAELRRVSLTREHLSVGVAASLGSLMTPELATAVPSLITSLQPSPELPDAAYALDVLPVLIRRAASRAVAQVGAPSA